LQWQRHILLGGQRREQIERLEHEADLMKCGYIPMDADPAPYDKDSAIDYSLFLALVSSLGRRTR
jgi:hypothetical protein